MQGVAVEHALYLAASHKMCVRVRVCHDTDVLSVLFCHATGESQIFMKSKQQYIHVTAG